MNKRAKSNFKLRILRLSCMKIVNYIYIGIDLASGKAIVVDPAWNLREIERCLEEENAVLNKILITHSHMDHVNLADKMAKKYNIPVYISQKERDYYHFESTNLHVFQDGEQLDFGSMKVHCYVTPGHSKGSTCYLIENNLFTGDTVFIEGCGMCKFAGGSAEDMYHSFQRLKASIADEVLVYPAHRYHAELGQTMQFVKDHNIYFAIQDIETFVKFRNRPNIKGAFRFK